MQDLVFALNAVCPIVLLVALGYFLKRIGIIPKELAKPLNKIVFRVLLPAMLFNNVYNIPTVENIELGYVAYAAAVIAIAFVIGFLLSPLLTRERSRRAILIQTFFRSNFALIGISLATSIAGTAGAERATLLSAVSIPMLNVFAIIALSTFDPSGERPSVKKILRGIITNPLILSIGAGLFALGVRYLLGAFEMEFSLYEAFPPIQKSLSYLSGAATPIALLTLGAQFEFSAVGNMKREIIAGTLIRTFIVPAAALAVSLLFDFTPGVYAAFIGVFTTPLAVSSVPMAQEMGSDSELCGQLVIFTTLASGIGIFLFTWVMKTLGAF